MRSGSSLLLAALVLCLATGCTKVTSQKTEKPAIVITDFRGKSLQLNSPPTRIVCLIESVLSGLYMLGAEQRVIGVSSNVYQEPVLPYYAALDQRIAQRRLPAPGNWDWVSIENVIALQPDLVIIWAGQTETITALEERGIPVFGIFLKNFDDVYREIYLLGELTGEVPRSREIVAYTQHDVDLVRQRIASIPRNKWPQAYFMWAQGSLETSGRPSTVDDLFSLAGADNVCGSIRQEHAVVNLEQVLSWNPALIVMWDNATANPEKIMSDPQWQNIAAVRTQRVYELPDVFLCDLWTLKFSYAIKLMAKWAHPDLFSDMDPAKEKARMFQFLYQKGLTDGTSSLK